MMNNKTILISGAGIAGPTLAFWLRAGGFEPTLIEQAPALRTGGYVIDFWGLGYDIAEHMGLKQRIEDIGYHMRELRVVDERGRRRAGFGIEVFNELTAGRYVSLARSDLSRLLFDEIKDHTEVLFGEEITSLRERGDGVQVAFRQEGDRRFDLVIGADGLHSSVRRLAFGPERSFEKRLGYAVAAFRSHGYRPRDEDIYVMYGGPGRMVGRFALHDDRTLFLFVFATGDDPPLPQALDRQKEMLRTIYGDGSWECPQILAQLDAAPELYFDGVSQIRMDSWTKGRVALVGDAAFCVSLVAGQGSALAMISAYVLAGALTRAEGKYEEAFRDYDNILREYIGKKQRGAERFAAAFAPRTRYGLWFRNQVLNACALPGLARLAVGGGIIDTLRLPDFRWPRA